MPYAGSHLYDETYEPEEIPPETSGSEEITPETYESEEIIPDNSFMFHAQQQHHSQPPLCPTSTHEPPHSWPPFDQTLLPHFQSQPLPYRNFHTSAPYPPQRLSSTLNTTGGGHVIASSMARLSLAGSLDPTTGIFYRAPEHPRLRTAQACDKCRKRKAKCSGERPRCKRCVSRNLICDYAKEGRVRGPNKTKNSSSVGNSSLKRSSTSGPVDLEQGGIASSSRNSINSDVVSPLTNDIIAICEKIAPRISSGERSPPSPTLVPPPHIQSPSRVNFTGLSQHSSPHTSRISQDLYSLSLTPVTSSEPTSRRNSSSATMLGEHRHSRPRVTSHLGPDSNNQWRQWCMEGNATPGWINQTNAGVNLTDLAEVPLEFSSPQQQQYQRQCLARQQHQRHLEEQQRLVAYQHRMLQQNNTVQMDYQVFQSEPSSFPIVSAPALHQRMNSGIGPVFQTQYQELSVTGDLGNQQTVEYAQGLHPVIQTPGYPQESQAASMTHQESYQRATTVLESTEQGLYPSLSRIEKILESFDLGSDISERSVASCPSGVDHGHGHSGVGNGDQQRWV